MADIKDILGVPRSGLAPGSSEPKEKKEKVKRPEGMSREAFALLGGSHPIISSHLADGLKKQELTKLAKPKPSTRGVLTYQYRGFSNPARSDGLELTHWVKGFRDASGRVRDAEEEYAYAKLNKKVQLYKYDDEEWLSLIADYSRDWSREESDYLIDLCERLDLRFVVIADRYNFPGGPPRSVEDLKDRYYSIARRLVVAREGGEGGISNTTLIKYPFNRQHEIDRKRALNLMLSRTVQQMQDENVILAEARVVEEKRRAEGIPAAAARKAAAQAQAAQAQAAAAAAAAASAAASAQRMAAQRADGGPADYLRYPLDFPSDAGLGVPTLLDTELQPYRTPAHSVNSRLLHTGITATAMGNAMTGGARALKGVETTLQELGWPPEKVPRINTRAVCAAWLALRGEIVALHDLKRSLQNRGINLGGGEAPPRGKEVKRRR